MRTFTLVFSVIAHALVIAAVIIAPAIATDVLPDVQRSTTFIVVRPEMPSPPAVIRRTAAPVPVTAAPVVEPVALLPERPAVAMPADPGATSATDPGAPPGLVGAGGDPLPPPAPRPTDPVHVGGVVQPPKKLTYVPPVYPPIALAARKEGLVILEALIAEDGTVRDVTVLRSDPLFDEAAMAAVRQWRFTPTRLNGEPVPLLMTVTVGFTLTR
jgi:protein TonB